MAKLVKYILIPIFFVFVMSHNASALPVNYDLSDYEMISSFTPQIQCTYKTASALSPAWTCPINGGDALRIIKSVNNYSFSKDDIITADLVIYNSSNYTGQSLFISFPYTVPGNNFELLDFSLINDSSVYVDVPSSPILQGLDVYRVYSVAFLSTATSSRTIGFWPTGNYNNFLEYVGGNGTDPIQVRLYNFKVWRRTKTQVNQEQEQATQDAADQSETAGGSSASSSQQGTASLISAIGSAVSAITSASPTNCRLNGNMGNLDVGQIDLCANPVPTFVQIIGSIILILMVVPLCITLFNRFIGLFRSFQS